MHRDLVTLTLLVPLTLATGCFEKELVCTDLAAVSVTVTVTDADGQPLDTATVTFDDGSGPRDCSAFEDGVWMCGYEVAGDLVITVSADGYTTEEQTVTVGADECHVIGEALTVALSPVDCTTEVVPSVRATVVGSSGETLTGIAVSWAPDASAGGTPCSGSGESWTCGEEYAGPIYVTAGADGHVPVTLDTVVEADVCHVITEELSFSLDWAAD